MLPTAEDFFLLNPRHPHLARNGKGAGRPTRRDSNHRRERGRNCIVGTEVYVNFVAVDVETANSKLASVCQIGIAEFQSGTLTHSWQSLVNPEDDFDGINVSIHGIDEEAVQDAPTWAGVFPSVSSLIREKVVVCHTAFDRVAVTRACERYALEWCPCRWLDSARVARRAWTEFAQSGYGLSNLAVHFGITYREHDALEDARCAGEILLLAIAETKLSTEQWLERVEQPIGSNGSQRIERDGNSEGPLYGEVLVFTGTLSMPRRVAADAAAEAGCRVDGGVTKQTTLLVVGDEDLRKLAGHDKSSKHRKAEELIAKGQPIRILAESDFQHIVLRRLRYHDDSGVGRPGAGPAPGNSGTYGTFPISLAAPLTSAILRA